MPRDPNVGRKKKHPGNPKYPADRHDMPGRYVRLRPAHWEYVGRIARRTGQPITAVIRDIIDRAYRSSL